MIEPYIKRVVSGDTNAFRFIINHYKQMVFSVAMQIVRDNHLAEDAAQETFFKAYKNIKKFKGKSQFSTWLYRIAVNESLALLKQPWAKDDSVDLKEELYNPSENLVEDLLELTERKHIINQALLQLKPKESLVLQLFYLQEQSVAEVARIIGIKKEHVKVLLHRARKNIYEVLSKQFANELKVLL